MDKLKLSVALATHNEERNLGRCLESIKDIASDIVIVDGESSDKTIEVAESFKAKVIREKNPPIFHINKQKAIDACSGDWILQLDADEVPDMEQKTAIVEILTKGSNFDAFYLKRKNFFLGRFMKKGGMYPDPVIRYFKKGKAFLPCISVHEQMEVIGTTGTLDGHLLHYTNPTIKDYLNNSFYRYGKLRTMDLKKEGVVVNPKSIFNYCLILPLKMFFSLYIIHKGFVDSWQGFVFAFLSALQIPYAYIKLIKNK